MKNLDQIFDAAMKKGFGNLHIHVDAEQNLRAIIAVHSTQRGPAIGGCRHIPYECAEDAVADAIKLAEGMTYKAAINNLPHGGAKAVIMHPKHIPDREAYFHSYGRFVDTLNGVYVTAPDANSSIHDMDIIHKVTPHVLCTSDPHHDNNPAIFTALGVRRAIEAAVTHKLKRDSLEGLHVAIQGAGAVGRNLVKELTTLGATITIADSHPEKLEAIQNQFDVQVTDIESIFSVECDVFSPCALGGILSSRTLPLLNTKIIAGAANNQLRSPEINQHLTNRDIFYVPDFVANAGGLIFAAALYRGDERASAKEQTLAIYDNLLELFNRAQAESRLTLDVCDTIVKERLQ